MASFNPSFSPYSIEKPWVDQISKTLKTQIAITVDTPPASIFEIPKILKIEKIEAYVPQHIGFGPKHHFQPELYHDMEQKKLTAVKRLLKPHQIQNFEQEIVEKIKKIVPVIRECYDVYHDADDNTLAWLFAIDGMFLIDQLDCYSTHGFAFEPNDLIMLENQIPLIVLNEIQKVLSGKNAKPQEDSLESKFRFFCDSNSTFALSEKKIDFSRVNHLLDYMYSSIMNNQTLTRSKVEFTNFELDSPEQEASLQLLEAVIKFTGVIPGAEPIQQIIEFIMSKFPQIIEEKAMAEEIKVPTVSELRKMARVEFRLSPKNEGIRNINFVQGKVRYCYLPLITLNDDSEVILRNLVAYEKLMAKNSFTGGYGLELTEYVDFMCGIIDTAKDVKLLRDQKIIEGELSDEDIVKMFNGIGKSRVKMSVESELMKTVAQLNMVYESVPRVWVQRTIKKNFRASVRYILIVIIISSALILIREAYMIVCGFSEVHVTVVRVLQKILSRLLLFLGPKNPNEIV